MDSFSIFFGNRKHIYKLVDCRHCLARWPDDIYFLFDLFCDSNTYPVLWLIDMRGSRIVFRFLNSTEKNTKKGGAETVEDIFFEAPNLWLPSFWAPKTWPFFFFFVCFHGSLVDFSSSGCFRLPLRRWHESAVIFWFNKKHGDVLI